MYVIVNSAAFTVFTKAKGKFMAMLIGSDKQVEWATKIRSKLIAKWEKSPLFIKHKRYILKQSYASWWITVYKTHRSLDDICPKPIVKEEIATLEAFFS